MTFLEHAAAAAPLPVLQADAVVAGYGHHDILQGLDLQVGAGEIYALLGANGAGKSTTLNLFLGFLRPRGGRVRVNGIDPTAAPAQARRQLGYIPENVALYEQLTARENLAYLLSLAKQPADAEFIGAALASAGLAASAHDKRVASFSKGMRQKVALALALARRVPALLLDEPTSGLDPQASADFNGILRMLRSQGVAVLMVTHDLLGAADVVDRMGFIANGRLAEEVRAAGAGRFDVRALHARYISPEVAR